MGDMTGRTQKRLARVIGSPHGSACLGDGLRHAASVRVSNAVSFGRRVAALTAAGVVSTSMLGGVASADTYTLQSTFGLNVPSIGPSPQHVATIIDDLSRGEMKIEVHGV